MVFQASGSFTINSCTVTLDEGDFVKLPDELQFIANARKAQQRTNARMDGQVCILTGATSGVGYQAGQWTYSPSGLPIAILTGKLAADQVTKELG